MTRAATHAQLRPVQNVKPGWWVRSYDDDVETWTAVTIVIEGENIITRRKWVRIYTAPADDDARPLMIEAERGEAVLCCTAAEAKRAGLTT